MKISMNLFKYLSIFLISFLMMGSSVFATVALNKIVEFTTPEKCQYEEMVETDANIPFTAEQNRLYYAGADNACVIDIATAIRDNMTARKKNFVVKFETNRNDTAAIIKEAFELAVSEEFALEPEQGDYLAYQYKNYNYSGSVVNDEGINYYTITFNVTYFTTADEEKKVDTAIKTALDKMDFTGLNDYEKIKMIYDFVCSSCEYSKDLTNPDLKKFSAYGAIINHDAVCQGYSNLLYRMLKEAGFDTRIINNATHSWNIVKYDGEYYYLDATRDDQYYEKKTDYKYFLTCSEHFDKKDRDAKFNTVAFKTAYPIATVCMHTSDKATPVVQKVAATAVVNTTKTATVTTTVSKPAKATIAKLTAASKKFTIKWKKIDGVNGYEFQYATNKNFKSAKTVKVTNNKTTTKTVKGLKAKNTYYVRIRAYKTVNGKKTYGAWSAVKTVKIKK